MGLSTPEVVGTLDALDLLDLGTPGRGPENQETAMEEHTEDAWLSVRDDLLRRSGQGSRVPPPDVFDALAWYLPIHQYGYEWGIYIRESAVLMLARQALSRVEPGCRNDRNAFFGAVRAGLAFLYLYESFRHKAESFTVRYALRLLNTPVACFHLGTLGRSAHRRGAGSAAPR